MSKPRITIERTYKAALKDVWDLWTTKEGIESWWGPDGFTTKVNKLDLPRRRGVVLCNDGDRPGAGRIHAERGDAADDRVPNHLHRSGHG